MLPQIVTNVVIVEDDPQLRAGYARIVKNTAGFACIGEFRTAEEAVSGIEEMLPQLVLMDINLPGMSGIECIRELRPRFPAMSFLVLTMFGDSERIFEALRAGAVGYLLKRSTSEELVAAMRQVIAGGSAMSPEVGRLVTEFFFRIAPQNLSEGVELLSRREEEILRLLSEGCQYKEIAAKLEISIDTVRWFIRRIYQKLHVHSRTEAVVRYLKHEKRSS